MKNNLCSFLVVTTWLVLSAPAFTQQAPAAAPKPQRQTSDTEAGATSGLETGQPRPMTADMAKQLVAAAIKASCSGPKGSCSGSFCVVDDVGMLMVLESIDGVIAAAPKLCIAKAETPATWRRSTDTFQGAVNKGTNTSYFGGAFPQMEISPGGIPLFKDGRIVGGFASAGVGAATEQINEAVKAEAVKVFGKQGR